jgi:two-component system, cell cycle response regulator DivK
MKDKDMAQTVLIIEDNEQNMYLMTFLLEKAGFTVVQAFHGRDGLRLAGELKPLAILLDIQLPEINGYQVAESLKKNPDVSAIPIVAVTSYAMPGDRERILAAGATGYLEKPINPETFVSQIREYLPPQLRDDRRTPQ